MANRNDFEQAERDVGRYVGRSLVTGCIWPWIKGHLDYWWYFDDNIQGLRDEFRYLGWEKSDMDQNIEEARLHAESPTTEVEKWSEDGTKKLEEVKRILHGCEDLKAWNIFSRYSRGKRAKETSGEVAKLRNERNLIRISNPAPPSAMALISHRPASKFESRRRVEEDIMKFLRDDHVCMIAICGAGGIGKTTMARIIEDRVREEKLFDEIVHVVVSQQIDMLKIQKEIAELLGLKFSEDTLAARAHKLRIRLQDSKRKLIIFDDVWESFDPNDIGVPFENGFTKCKIILTSRITDACNKMGTKIIRMELLKKEEAWDLFKEKAGSCVEDPDLRPIAEDVAAECKCLPVALVTVGGALKDQRKRVWEDSLSQLRRSMPIDLPDVIKNVYKPLKLSYDFLEKESVKSLFLLCCLFPEDHNIPIERLALYGIGLGMFEGIRNIEEGRNRAHSFVEKLKSRFLLLDGHRRHEVKMHDVIRDVAIFIGSKEKKGFLKSLEVLSMDSSSEDSSSNCNWMSIDISLENAKLPIGSDFPNLRLMMIRDSTSHYTGHSSRDAHSELFNGEVICFEGMEGLTVLSLSGINLPSLPQTLKLLKQLRTLYLYKCAVKDISVFRELASLEILCIHECHNIEELPTDIGRLNHLRLLDLNECRILKKIMAGVVSSLVGLEELKISSCFDKWEAKGNQSEERNVGLSELESLPNLTSLEIYISDCNLVTEEIRLSQNLVRYNINYFLPNNTDDRKIRLDLPGDITIGNWIRQLVRSTQSLELRGDGSNNFNIAEIRSLKNLGITYCSTMKKLVNAVNCRFNVLVHLHLSSLPDLEEIIDGTILEGSNYFQNLESLNVEYLPKLECLWNCQTQKVSLGKLKSISIKRCPNLRYLFSVATLGSLVQLQRLEIEECDKIELMFWNEMESNTNAFIIEFPNLQELLLFRLPNLVAFFKEVEIIEFLHKLRRLTIMGCPKLKTKIGKCPNLGSVLISGFHVTHHLLCSSHMIKFLHISDCDIEEILWDEINDEGERHIIFSELWRLELSNLPRFTTFCRGVQRIKFPKLEWMEIRNLARLNNILPIDLEPTHDDHSLHFFCNPKVQIPGLKTLHLFKLPDVISKIWCDHHIPVNFFHNLKSLHISDVNGINNLMSSSIAKNLVNLYDLFVERCQEMVVVIEDEKEALVTSLFPKLRWVYLGRLHRLICFCQWKHALELPSLQSVCILDCPGLETFTLGLLSTPNLSDLEVNNRRVKVKDLNGGIRDQFRTKTEDEDDDED